jgi:hypothetical protein
MTRSEPGELVVESQQLKQMGSCCETIRVSPIWYSDLTDVSSGTALGGLYVNDLLSFTRVFPNE